MQKKYLLITSILIGLCLSPQSSAEEVIYENFELQPELSFRKTTIVDKGAKGALRERLFSTMPLYPVKNQSFVMQVDVFVHRIKHYCPVTLGFTDTKSGQSASLKFYRGDKSLTARVTYQPPTNGEPLTELKNLRLLDKQHITVRFHYNKKAQRLDVEIRDADGVVQTQFTFNDLADVSLDAFLIQTERYEDVGTVWYDPDARELYVKSIVNHSFTAVLSIKELILKFEKR